MIFVIDNYDSFTHNIVHALRLETDEAIKVARNDCCSLDEIAQLAPTRLIISPGPGRPEHAGISIPAIKKFGKTIPILGICLGHQAIAVAFGAKIISAKEIIHGKLSPVATDKRGLFRSIPSPAKFTRYHSLAVDPNTLPSDFEITATTDDGEIMGIRHKKLLIEGVQFHPESIASHYGRKLLRNFLNYRRESFSLSSIFTQIIAKENLSIQQARRCMEELTDGNLTDGQIGALLLGLGAKGISANEVAGCASVLIDKQISLPQCRDTLDTCGTGGDHLGTFNISSLSAIVAVACGSRVAKHGNSAISSKSGSADFYSALSIPVNLNPEQARQLLLETNFTFLFAPLYHSAMRHAASVRRQLGTQTIINLLGPLVNPARARHRLIGVFSHSLGAIMARAAKKLGIERTLIAHGHDGLDEISITGPTTIIFGDQHSTITPGDFGLPTYSIEELRGGEADENATMARRILDGTGSPALRDAVILNTAAALYVDKIAPTIANGVVTARTALATGKAEEKYFQIVHQATKIASQ